MNVKLGSLLLICATILSVAWVAPTRAAPITVPGFSFEDPGQGDGDVSQNGNATGWTVTGPSQFRGVYNSSGPQFSDTGDVIDDADADGSQVLYIDLPASGNTGTVTSANSLATVQGSSTYTLDIAVGRRLDAITAMRESSTYISNLLVDGTVVASSTLIDGSTLGLGELETFSLVWNSGLISSGDLTIRIDVENDGPGFQQAIIDNVRLDIETANIVPEPMSFVLLGIGLLGMGWYRCRRNK